jgi:hypothetical protein
VHSTQPSRRLHGNTIRVENNAASSRQRNKARRRPKQPQVFHGRFVIDSPGRTILSLVGSPCSVTGLASPWATHPIQTATPVHPSGLSITPSAHLVDPRSMMITIRCSRHHTPLQWPSLEHQIWTGTPSATTWNTRSAAVLPTDAQPRQASPQPPTT